MEKVLLPILYAGNISYYKAFLQAKAVTFEIHGHFEKQTFRNRCEILGPNGIQKLTVPTVKTGQRRPFHSVQASYAENWQKLHWKSLEAAYRSSPYFEYYEDRFRPFYKEKTDLLMDFNLRMHEEILDILGIVKSHSFTNHFETATSDYTDLRDAFEPSKVRGFEHRTYLQVFTDRHPFAYNLSILDAIFNLGPRTLELL